jgi:anti-sigma factor ChrR (cupin superfamily)
VTRPRHLAELLPEYAAGILPAALEVEVRDHLVDCRACSAELRGLEEVLTQLSLALPAPPPPPALRTRILDAALLGGRFDRFLGRVAALLDVTAARARELLALIDHAGVWRPGPAATSVIHLAAGARVAEANCGFVLVRAGAAFPEHRHLGSEHVLVLQGGFVDDTGRRFRPGDEDIATAGSSHAFTAEPGVDLVFLLVLEIGIEIAGGPATL